MAREEQACLAGRLREDRGGQQQQQQEQELHGRQKKGKELRFWRIGERRCGEVLAGGATVVRALGA
jgi:hypothetical protein